MGFGLLLIGYVFAFVATVGMGSYAFAGLLLGSFLMYLGIGELKKYSPVFLYAYLGSVLIILCAFYESAVWADGFLSLGLGLNGALISKVYYFIKLALEMLFNFAMLYGVADLSKRVDFPDTRKKAIRNMYFVGLFNICQIVLLMPIGFIQAQNEKNGFFMTFLMILELIYTVVNAFLLFKCYAMICPEGQEDMPRKPSRFAFVNKMRAARDAKEEKAIEDMKKYYEDKRNKKNQKKQSNHKKKR